jgi:hypothetical protein
VGELLTQGNTIGRVDMMLKLHKDLSKTKTPHEQESLKRTIAATDKRMTIW